MNDVMPEFNAWTGAWLPLLREDGTTRWASPIEVLSGEQDGVDLDYPRDDFRVYARLLLSALVQALFPAKDKGELKQRLASPISRKELEDRIGPVSASFDLFGPTPFLQIVAPAEPRDKGAAAFVFGATDLYQPQVSVEAVSLAIALVAIFVEQTYAGGAGRGYGAGPGGQPGAFTLIDAGSIRSSAWANTLTTERVAARYAKDKPGAWSNSKQAACPRAAIGIVGGLFFQPRSIWLIPSGQGRCSFTGKEGPLVRLSPFLPKSELASKSAKSDDIWTHPCAPLAVNSVGIGAIRLNADRPTWTGLAQLLSPVSKDKARATHPLEGPAPVLTQWRSLSLRGGFPRLILLDFDRDKASVKRRFFEGFPLQSQIDNEPAIERIRALSAETQAIEGALVKALKDAHDDRKAGGLALADARCTFWSTTEPHFAAWLAQAIAIDDGSDESFAKLAAATADMLGSLRRKALAVFNAHASLSEFDPRKQAKVARARRKLSNALWPRPSSTPKAAQPEIQS